MILTRKEKESLVIKLAEEGKSSRYIAEAVHISLKDIGTIIRKHTGEEAVASAAATTLSTSSKAFKLFRENMDLVNVAITLDMDAYEVLDRFNEYLQLSNMDKLRVMYWDLGNEDIQLLECLYHELKKYGLANRKDIFNIVQHEDKIKSLDKVVFDIYGEIGRLNSIKTQLEKEVGERMRMLGICDSIMMENDQDV